MTGSRRLQTLGLAGLLGVIGGTAFADCSDFAAPGVYWRRCLQDGQDLRGVDLSGANLADASFKRTDLSGADLVGRRRARGEVRLRDHARHQAGSGPPGARRSDQGRSERGVAAPGRPDQRAPVPRRSQQGRPDRRPARRCRPAQGDIRRRDLDRRQDRVRRELGRSVQSAARGSPRSATPSRAADAGAGGAALPITSGAKRSPGRGAGRAAARASRARARRCARHSARPPRTCRPACPGR